MLLFASGKYTGTPEPYLVFINIFIGYMLAGMYTLSSTFEWYPVFFSLVHIASFSTILWKIWRTHNKSVLVKWIYFSVFIALELRFILLFEFTTTAAISALAGLVLMRSGSANQRILGILYFIIGGMIRFEVAMLVGLVTAPLFLSYLVTKKKWNTANPMITLFVALSILFLFKYLDTRIYNADPDWAHYKAYNANRGAINDNPNGGSARDHLPVGITDGDYQLLLGFFADPHHVNLSRISEIRQTLKSESLGNKMRHFLPFLRPFRYHILLLFIIAGGVLLGLGPGTERWIVLSSFFVFFATLFYISLDASIKHRIFFTACLPLLFIFFEFSKTRDQDRFSGIMPFAVLVLTLLILKENWTLRKLRQEARVTKFLEQQLLVKQYMATPGNRILPFGNDLTVQLYPVFNLSKNFSDGNIIFSGWAANIPYDKTRFHSFQDLPGQYGIFFTKEDAGAVVPLIQASILRNYGMLVTPQIELKSSNYMIVKFHR